MKRVYKIRPALKLIMLADAVLLFVLFLFTILGNGGILQTVLSGFFTVMLFLVSAEITNRSITLESDRLILRKFLKNRVIMIDKITELDALSLRNRVHFLITSHHGLHFFSNAYVGIYSCLQHLKNLVDDAEKVTAAFDNALTLPRKSSGDIIGGVVFGVATIFIIYLNYCQ
ncbi:MAG: hypothetical protein K9K75_05035 [Deltaproteobacteria bacterium]|nr:hypothetical protein [Deltaproteobacteria bacterium]